MRGALLLFLGLLLAVCCSCGPREAASPASAPAAASALPRVVSLNPSLTAILLALDARDALVGVDEFSAAQQPEVADLPRVGGLFSPSLEAVAALQPDAVVVVPSVEQRDFVSRLRELGVRVIVCENIELSQVLENIALLGDLVGHQARAAERIGAIERTWRTAQALAETRPRPRALLVLQRDPVFVVGRGGFLDEMIEVAGATNLGAELGEPYPQVAVEWLVDAGPEVLIDMTVEDAPPLMYWSRWSAIPAVASRRVMHLDPKTVTLPGPWLDRAVEALVAALHGPAAADALRVAAAPEASSEG